MKSLKIKPKERDMPIPANMGSASNGEYPFWTRICGLDGFDLLNECDIGDEVMIVAKAKVTAIREEEHDGECEIKYDIQMTDMDIKEPDKFGDSFERAAKKQRDSRDIEEG